MARIIRSGAVAEISRRCEVRCRQFAVAIEEIMDRTRDSRVPVFEMLKLDRPMAVRTKAARAASAYGANLNPTMMR